MRQQNGNPAIFHKKSNALRLDMGINVDAHDEEPLEQVDNPDAMQLERLGGKGMYRKS